MSLQDHVNKQSEPQDAARDALLNGIAKAAAETTELNRNNQAAALRDLAEAYAWVISPSNAH
ncbi:hypothetical protein ACPXCP_31185 [Streptomyces sp. DT20]|uniref:hypothetical protein n=1 Tax=Streptomyces sp. DT20 TaxID=3416519 RepID=UPI003CF1CBC8